MIAALAGRRIDDSDSDEPRFPLKQRDQVEKDLRELFQRNKVTKLVCSGACGADLIALEVAGALGIDRHMVLPFEIGLFRSKSVTDRSGNWGPVFDRMVSELKKSQSIKALAYKSDDKQAFEKTNEEIIKIAKQHDEDKIAIVVWEGVPKDKEDATLNFKQLATREGVSVHEILIKFNYKLEFIERARRVLNRQTVKSSEALEKLYKTLEEWDQFSYATDVLLFKITQDHNDMVIIDPEKDLKQKQRLAKYIYKDHSLPSAFKFDRALEQLNSNCDLRITDHCETLGLAGAIYKRKWHHDHLFKNLELSHFYYKRGFESWRKYLRLKNEDERSLYRHCDDNGWTAINYAFVNELMAVDELEQIGKVVGLSSKSRFHFDEAREVRTEILRIFVKDPESEVPQLKTGGSKWEVATVAEALFGLAKYDGALEFICQYLRAERNSFDDDIEAKVLAWKIRSFAQQIATIAYLQTFQKNWVANEDVPEESKTYLNAFARDIDDKKIQECLRLLANPIFEKWKGPQVSSTIEKEGKLGLALSGGGLRAAFYHIGVLAALADSGKLRDIEVISCVSGGSILGTYYYLKLKKEIESKPDGTINHVSLIKELEQEFLTAIQENIRMRIFSNPMKNFRMVFDKNYSRTNRLGELYQKHLYGSVLQQNRKHVEYMCELLIEPFGNRDFSIATDNWSRIDKVPQLILNATSVNTGHNFQFTASWMGEPPGYIQPDIDVKPRLRRMYYHDAPEEYKKFKLGYAVAASSCVPVMFEPLPMYDLYIDSRNKKVQLQLIDGGLHDNQGIASLIEQECKNMIISDASGQMSTTLMETGTLSLFYRADTILQERIREIQFMDLKERNNSVQLRSLFSLHLKNGLQKRPWSWKGCTDPIRMIFDGDGVDEDNPYTECGLLREAQTLISEIRTDLDSFNDVEAYAIMYCGYSHTHAKLGGRSVSPRNDWAFLQIKPYLTDKKQFSTIKKILKSSSKVPFKVFRISEIAQVIAGFLILSSGYLSVMFLRPEFNSEIGFDITIGYVLLMFAFFILGLISEKLLMLFNLKSIAVKKLLLIGLGLVGFLFSIIYLLVLNKLYNNAGKLRKKISNE